MIRSQSKSKRTTTKAISKSGKAYSFLIGARAICLHLERNSRPIYLERGGSYAHHSGDEKADRGGHIRELHGNRDSLVSLGIGVLSPVIVGSAVVLLTARIIARYEPAPGFSVLFAEWGLMFWVGGYLLMMRNTYHEEKLKENLAKKPESSNQSLEPTAGRRTERLKDEL